MKRQNRHYWAYLSCLHLQSKTSVSERIQENILDYSYNRIKLLNKVHIEYIVEATNIILRDVTHTKR